MKKYLLTFILIALLIPVMISCGKTELNTDSNNIDQQSLSYDEFVKFTQRINNYTMEDFFIISPTEGIMQECTAFPETDLDTRVNDGVGSDSSKPSKYTFYFFNKEKNIFIKTSFIYEQTNIKGILYQTTTSPYRDYGLQEKYGNLSTPFIDTTMISRGDYLIFIEGCLLDESLGSMTNEDKDAYLVQTDVKFLKEIEKFIMKENK